MRYFLRRAGFFAATLWAAVTLNFLIPRLQPGDPAETIVQKLSGQNKAIDPAQVTAVRKMLGTPDGNLLQQYVDYMGAVVKGEFGVSYTYFPYPVTHMIGQALWWTVILVGVTHVISFVIGTLMGAWAAYRRNTRTDSFITLGSTFVGTLPFFWLALLLIYVFAFTLNWFPERGGWGPGSTPGWNWLFISDAVQHSVLPGLALLIVGPIGWIIGMRNNMVQTLGEDYARLARAKGLPQTRIALTYGARIAVLPNVTGFAMALGGILGGTVLVESIFNYPGLGRMMLDAVSNRDYPLMQALFLFITIGVLLANFLADMLYGVLDPRVRKEAAP
ncbi:ABC transporter permease [Nonomuraea sp. MG754425]|uniref:ABC transporter permease n=1 Tax=Nonomuraea sp. MG754425 TaxID=2570319 RepID=UPI001F1EF8CD|nr:ABC transporter permease [Nonomuraea sp. MG754425]MCF6471781.1 ABC transporter permease [Nonomuraea sp. MG754425]